MSRMRPIPQTPTPAHHPAQAPACRLGPRPLPLHLMTALYASLSLPVVWRNLKNASASLRPNKNAEPLQKLQNLLVENLSLPALENIFDAALRDIAFSDAHYFLSGVRQYQTCPLKRRLPEAPVIWQEGHTKLRDYAPHLPSATSILVIPSLINRYHILDLDSDQSFLRFLVAHHLRPLLVDWDTPDETERHFTLDALMAHRLMPILAFILQETGQAPHIMGYCMGGLLALALATLGKTAIRSISLLATPWDFGVTSLPDMLRQEAMLRLIRESGFMPVDMIQSLFALQQPLQTFRKFRDFGRRMEAGMADDDVRRFVLVEDWLNDGVPLAAPVALACLRKWYGQNAPMKGTWSVGGQTIDPRRITIPSCVVIPRQDRVVSPAAAKPLATLLPDCFVLEPDTGHIGMMASRRANAIMWQPFLEWITSIR